MGVQQVLVWVGALTAVLHQVDQARHGEASPGGVFLAAATAALAGAYPRLPRLWRAASAALVGLVWTGAAIRNHLLPVLAGDTGPGDLSGVVVVIGGLALIAAGVLALREGQLADR